jgi:hypothetical protein
MAGLARAGEAEASVSKREILIGAAIVYSVVGCVIAAAFALSWAVSGLSEPVQVAIAIPFSLFVLAPATIGSIIWLAIRYA